MRLSLLIFQVRLSTKYQWIGWEDVHDSTSSRFRIKKPLCKIEFFKLTYLKLLIDLCNNLFKDHSSWHFDEESGEDKEAES